MINKTQLNITDNVNGAGNDSDAGSNDSKNHHNNANG